MKRRQDECLGCGSCVACEKEIDPRRIIGVEYAHGSENRYDGVSEWICPECGRREGRWTGRVLRDGESEPPHGKQRQNR
jgi:hypothetical protein